MPPMSAVVYVYAAAGERGRRIIRHTFTFAYLMSHGCRHAPRCLPWRALTLFTPLIAAVVF